MSEIVDEISDSAESEKTAPESPPRRSSHEDVSKGIQIGRKRLLKELGFQNVESLIEALSQDPDASREVEKTDEKAEKDQPQKGHSQRELLKLKKDIEKLSFENDRLRKLSDEARLMKLRAVAMEQGVGPGKQLDAFVRMYGDLVSMDDTRELIVLSQLDDGSMEPVGESIDDYVKKALEESPFLRPYDRKKGTGIRHEKAEKPEKKSKMSPLAEQVFGGGSVSSRDRLFGGVKK